MFFKLIICVVILKEVAEQQGNLDESQTLQSELEELEERAQELDKMRSKGLSAIR
jgi:RNA polymerase-associated protein RTF1